MKKIIVSTTRKRIIILLVVVLPLILVLSACGTPSASAATETVATEVPVSAPVQPIVAQPTNEPAVPSDCVLPTDYSPYEKFDQAKANSWAFGDQGAGDYIVSQTWSAGAHLLTIQSRFSTHYRGLPIYVCPSGQMYMYLPPEG